NFVNPRATLEVAEGIGQYLCENNLSSVQEIIGALN
ncbi:MAG TPA: dihydroorotate dehydrogenase, partial [Firmicutes bacterium]|nr:dihydroorotate dehydrogenase [Bacillota bacterium]